MDFGVQTDTIRRELKEDLLTALKDLKDYKVKGIELARIPFDLTSALIVSESGLKVYSVQVKFKTLKKKIEDIVSFCKAVNCNIAVISVLPLGAILGKEKAMKRFCEDFNDLYLKYSQLGIELCFHHHDFEFKKIKNRTKFDVLLENTNPKIRFILDTYWIKKSRIEPHEWIEKLGNRVIGLHLRDHMLVQKGNKLKSKDTEIGNGDIDFKKVFESALPYAIYGVIEQNTSTPYQSIKQSIKYVNNHHLLD